MLVAGLRGARRTPHPAGPVVRGLLARPVRRHLLRPGIRQRFLGLRGDLLPEPLLPRGPHARPGGHRLRAARAHRDRGLRRHRLRRRCRLGDVVFATVFVGGPWATGLALRLRRELAVANERLRVEQEEKTRRAIAEERSHDRPGAARRGGARHLGDRAAVARCTPDARPGRGEGPQRAWTPSSTPTPRHSATCDASSRSSGTPRVTARAPHHSPRCPGSTSCSRTSAGPGSRWRSSTAGDNRRRASGGGPLGVPDHPGGAHQRAQARGTCDRTGRS